jgi:hypothetical protein
MHARDLADLAALVSVHGPQLVSASPRLVDQALEAYWAASRFRIDRWCGTLRTFSEKLNQQSAVAWSPEVTQAVEEVFVSEILTRCFAAILSAHDRHHRRAESDPIGRNIMNSHRDASRRATDLFNSPANISLRHTESLGELQGRCQRWNDLLLAYVSKSAPVADFAFDNRRVQEFAVDASRHIHSAATNGAATTMLSAGMRSTLELLSAGDTPNADLNRQIAAAVLACFGPEFFDSHGLLRSVWLDRLQSVPDETLALIHEWWQPAPAEIPLPPPLPPKQQLRPFKARWDR